jgi:hypothetical protein
MAGPPQVHRNELTCGINAATTPDAVKSGLELQCPAQSCAFLRFPALSC